MHVSAMYVRQPRSWVQLLQVFFWWEGRLFHRCVIQWSVVNPYRSYTRHSGLVPRARKD